MIGLDTNVLVRYITKDDPVQTPKAKVLIEGLTTENPGFISLTVVLEFLWVLSSWYELDKPGRIRLIDTLLRTDTFVVEHTQVVWNALHLYRNAKADFEDCLIQCRAASVGCDYVATFDLNAAKTAGMRLIR